LKTEDDDNQSDFNAQRSLSNKQPVPYKDHGVNSYYYY